MELTTKYAAAFKRLAANPSLYKPDGNTLLVEVLPKQELKSKGGIILGKADTHKATSEDFRRDLGLVLLRGAEVDSGAPEEGELILMPFNPLYLSEFPGLNEYTQGTLALVDASSVLFRYPNAESFNKAKELLNATEGENIK